VEANLYYRSNKDRPDPQLSMLSPELPNFAINLWNIFEKNPDEKPESKPSPATQLLK